MNTSLIDQLVIFNSVFAVHHLIVPPRYLTLSIDKFYLRRGEECTGSIIGTEPDSRKLEACYY